METTKSPVRITKAHLITLVIADFKFAHGHSPTRLEVMKRVHSLLGRSPETFAPNSNGCYWAPKALPGPYGVSPVQQSVLQKGLVVTDGKRGNVLTYALTPEGKSMVRAQVCTVIAAAARLIASLE